MKLYDKLYVGEMKDSKVIRYVIKIRAKKHISDLYCITFPLMQDGILEIYKYEELRQPQYQKFLNEVTIIGIARKEYEAYEIVRSIIDEVYTNTHEFDVQKYLGYS